MVPISQQSLTIDKIDSELGYVQIQIDEIETVSKYDIVLHIIDPNEILDIVDELEGNINATIFDSKKNIVLHQIENIRNGIKTLIPRRQKREKGRQCGRKNAKMGLRNHG